MSILLVWVWLLLLLLCWAWWALLRGCVWMLRAPLRCCCCRRRRCAGMLRTQRILLLLYRVLCSTNAQDERTQLLRCGVLTAQAAPTHSCILPGP
jgi:hypothetical protein